MMHKLNPDILKFNNNIQKLCMRSYQGHPKGCPNWHKKKGCPPKQPLINNILDFTRPIYIIYTIFNLHDHYIKMKTKHPDWTDRQCYCCLYWQPRARKKHKEEIMLWHSKYKFNKIVSSPEAHGVNITALMKDVLDIDLEWMPKNFAYQISLIGTHKH